MPSMKTKPEQVGGRDGRGGGGGAGGGDGGGEGGGGGEGEGGGGDGGGGVGVGDTGGGGEGGGDGGGLGDGMLGSAIQPIFQSQPVALLVVMPGRFTYTRKLVAVIWYWYDPPFAFQCLFEPVRLLETIGALVKPHPEMSTSR